MPTTGRNEPCPCGSGKKYKHCCMPKDRAAQVRQVARDREDEQLWLRLLKYVERPTFFVDTQSAFSRFWNADFDVRVARVLDRQAMEAFLEWYVYDYPTSRDRQRIVELFATEEGPRLSPEQRELLAEHAESYLSLYGIEEAGADGRLAIGDLVAGGLYEVHDAGLARLAKPGDLLLGRRFGGDGRGRLSRGTVLLPGEFGAALAGVAKRAFAVYRDEHYQATWQDFLREAGYVMFHYLLSPDAAQTYDRLPRREGYFDPRAAVEHMRQAARLLAEAEERERTRAERAGQAGPGGAPLAGPHLERTAGGLLIPGQPAQEAGAGRRILLPGDVRSGQA